VKTSEIGDIFENIACKYLKSNGYRVISRNLYVGKDEIDIIAKEKASGILVFIEVKGGRVGKNFRPEIHFSRAKAQKFSRACRMFAGKHPKLIGECGYRLDLVAISLKADLLKDWKRDCEIRHYENVLA
jgi:putative endonuclease